ncbi:MAG: hypothetical protein GVY36_17015 [Verrucomicrobia bacterium]|jgi:hypothetical protein|nr:hypothetical protein [Verrucomicrobiota bacterium]
MAALEAKGRFAIWKRTSSPKGNRIIRKDIKSYLSEQTKPGVDQEAFKAGNHPNWLKQGVDYLTKEEQGKLKAFGFLRDDIFRQAGRIPHQMENNELIYASLGAWESRKKKKKIKRAAHKYVLSLNPEMCEVMAQTGHSADELLTHVVRKVLRRYQEKYYPGEKLGYLMGIHHDKAHLHAHVMLFPTTESGKLLLVTDYSKKNKKHGHKRPFTDMRLFAEKEVARYYEKEIKSPFRASERNPAKYAQPKLVSLLAYKRSKEAMEKSEVSPEQRQAWAMSERDRILLGDQRELQGDMKEIYEATEGLFEEVRETKKSKEPADFRRQSLKVNAEKAQLAEQMKNTQHQLKDLKLEAQAFAKIRRDLYMDSTNWSHYRYNHGSAVEGGNNLRGPEVFDWFQRTMADSSELGVHVRTWVEQKRQREERILLSKETLAVQASAENPIAAQKFTEKDRFARECISLGAGKLKNPMIHMLESYHRQNELLSRRAQKDFVREFLNHAILVHRDKQKEIQQRREELSRRVKELRLQQQSNKLKQDIFEAVEKGRRPDFLEEYRHWKNADMEIPIDALNTMRAGVESKQRAANEGTLRGANKVSDRPNDNFATRLHENLRRLRSMRTETGSFTLRGGMADYHRGGADPKTRLHETRKKVVDNTLDRRSVQEFLRSLPDVVGQEVSAEERRKEVRARRMEQDEIGGLDR